MSDFEKKISEFKNILGETQDAKLIETLKTEIFGKNGLINHELKKLDLYHQRKRKFLLLL